MTIYHTTHIYDPAGNRVLQIDDGAVTTFSYDAANQLMHGVRSSGTTNYRYDAEVIFRPILRGELPAVSGGRHGRNRVSREAPRRNQPQMKAEDDFR